jgi:hypothetical protein
MAPTATTAREDRGGGGGGEGNLYWLRSAAMAVAAAALTCGGAGKSGKPSARLTAPTRCARWDSCWMGDGADRLDTADSLRSMAAAG